MRGISGERFKEIREELGLTQDQMAEVLFLYGKQAVSNIESGRANAGALMSSLMESFVELPEKQSVQLRELLISISARLSKAAARRK